MSTIIKTYPGKKKEIRTDTVDKTSPSPSPGPDPPELTLNQLHFLDDSNLNLVLGLDKEFQSPSSSPSKTKTKTDFVAVASPAPAEERDSIVNANATSPAPPGDEDIPTRRCVVCLEQRTFTEDIFDTSKPKQAETELYPLYDHIYLLIAHLNIQVKDTSTPTNTGLCPECMHHLQRWHIFNSTIAKRQELAKSTESRILVVDYKTHYQTFESQMYKHYRTMAAVKEMLLSATHGHYARRHLTEKDLEFFSDRLFQSLSLKSEKLNELGIFLTSREKLSKLFCLTCNILIPDGMRGYRNHVEEAHQQSPILFPCDICGSSFPGKDQDQDAPATTKDYFSHWISHFFFHKCHECVESFPTVRLLGQHRRRVHKTGRTDCEKCGKVLATEKSLNLHLQTHLPDGDKAKSKLQCKICKKMILWCMKTHLATHTQERPWKCDQCDLAFKIKGHLVSHRNVVHFNKNRKLCVCSLCGAEFKTTTLLRDHMNRHDGRRDHKCELCEKAFYNTSSLKCHKKTHKPDRDFVCATCGKAFKRNRSLQEHATLHTGEMPYICPICGKRMRVKSYLNKHVRAHKKNAAAVGPGPGTNISKSSTVTMKQEQEQNPTFTFASTGSSGSTVTATATAIRAPNGTVTVTLDNGIVVREMTPFVLRLVTPGSGAWAGADPPTSTNALGNSENFENHGEISNVHAVETATAAANRNGCENENDLNLNLNGSEEPMYSHSLMQSSQFQPLSTMQIQPSNPNLVQVTELELNQAMQHDFQDRLNVPLALHGQFYTTATTTPQYFQALDFNQ